MVSIMIYKLNYAIHHAILNARARFSKNGQTPPQQWDCHTQVGKIKYLQ